MGTRTNQWVGVLITTRAAFKRTYVLLHTALIVIKTPTHRFVAVSTVAKICLFSHFSILYSIYFAVMATTIFLMMQLLHKLIKLMVLTTKRENYWMIILKTYTPYWVNAEGSV